MIATRATGDALALLSQLAAVRRAASVAAFAPSGTGLATLWGRRRDSGLWTAAGGHLEPGEPPPLGAAREFRQETGRHVHAADLEPLAGPRRAPDGCLLHFFRAWFAEPFAATGESDPDREVAEWRWWSSEGGRLPTALTANLHHRPNLLVPFVEELLAGWTRGPAAERLGLATAHDPHSGEFMSGPAHGGGDLHHEGKRGAHDFSRHSPRDLVNAYHAESKAGGMWTKRADGKMGRSERMDAVMGELSKRMKADGVTKKKLLIDDLDRWADKRPLVRRNPAEG
jgi:8-oxo-dGTP pyrophosphatase MutT (NUDIX family)